MLLIKVESVEVRKIEGNKNGRDYSFQIQEIYVYTVDRKTGERNKYPEKIEITLEKDQAPYKIGSYTLSPTSLYVDRSRHLNISPRLEEVPATAKA